MPPTPGDVVVFRADGRHPGAGRAGTRVHTRGRQLDHGALQEVREILGEQSRERRHLIAHLHAIQDCYGHLSARHLHALAFEMNLSQAQVYEVASFYSQLLIVRDGEAAPPPVVVRVCDGLACSMHGGDTLRQACERELGEVALVLRAPCMGRCAAAPVASVNKHHVEHADLPAVQTSIRRREFEPVLPAYPGFDDYVAGGGYRLLESCFAGQRTREDVIRTLSDSRLRGLGGAGYPAGQKWRSVLKLPAPKVVAVNFDESEMGTFKDRYFVEGDPHRLLEGVLLAAWAVDARQVYIYLRDEYHGVRSMLEQELRAIEAAGLSRHCPITLVRGAGAYVCGERSAMLESIEGKRGNPRLKDPRTTVVGLFGIPTLINNAETLFWVRDILERGAEWYAAQGRNGRYGPRAFSVSGRVRSPGVKLAQAGITMRQLLEEYCGGMAEGQVFKGYCLGGSAGGILPATMADIPLDFDTLEEYGCSIGSAAITVFSQQDSIRAIVLKLMRFFEDESCGQCTPCRVGTQKAVLLLERQQWDEAALNDLCEVMEEASICGLGIAAPHPIRSVLRYFRNEVALE